MGGHHTVKFTKANFVKYCWKTELSSCFDDFWNKIGKSRFLIIAYKQQPNMDDGPSMLYILYGAAHGLVVIGTLLGNIGTISAFWKMPGLREKPSNLLILCLSCADLGIGVVRTLDYPKIVLGYWPFRKLGCQVRALLSNVCVTIGILTVAMISLDRFLLVAQEYPMYLKTQSRTRVVCKIVAIWIYGIAIGFSEVIMWSYVTVPDEVNFDHNFTLECRSPVKHNAVASLTYYIIIIFLPLIVAEIFSILFVCLLRRKLRRPGSLRQHNVIQGSQTSDIIVGPINLNNVIPDVNVIEQNHSRPVCNPKKRYKKAAFVLFVLIFALNICLLPFTLYTLTISMICGTCNNKTVRNFLIDVVYLNSFINPFLYIASMEKIREFYRSLSCS